jgi:pimeloyl-ACP methyl ester carboxylesterase
MSLLLLALAVVSGCRRPAAVPGLREREVQRTPSADGVPIAYETHGTGDVALVFVHGWSCDRSYWRGQLAPFARDFTVVAVDLGGHGDSGLARDSWSIDAFGEDVAAVVTRLRLQRVVLVGHSLGGGVAIEAARRLPGRVVGVVWVDAFKELGVSLTVEQRQAAIAPFRADFMGRTDRFVRRMFPSDSDSALVSRVVADMTAAPPSVGIGALESAMLYNDRVPQALRELQLPVVAINADHEPTDTASLARHGIEVVMMPGVGHFPMLEAPPRFNATLRRVVSRLVR